MNAIHKNRNNHRNRTNFLGKTRSVARRSHSMKTSFSSPSEWACGICQLCFLLRSLKNLRISLFSLGNILWRVKVRIISCQVASCPTFEANSIWRVLVSITFSEGEWCCQEQVYLTVIKTLRLLKHVKCHIL